ncbi:hypothetical protein [Plantibacter sp. RU18]|uniref:hypothetical protein n=1 Tax=Plantibacter sp. RU18 TaxID=3158143 RepID=UPI003D367FBE
MTHPNPQLEALIKSVRPALRDAQPNEAERSQFIYDLVREVYDYAKFDVSGPGADTDERAYLGGVVDAALPPLFWAPKA